MIHPAAALAAEQIQMFLDFPPRQKPASFNLDAVLDQIVDAGEAVSADT